MPSFRRSRCRPSSRRHNGKPAGWLERSVNNAEWGVDYFSRSGTAKSNMFDNRPNETQYFYTDNDYAGAALDGSKTYGITFPAGGEPPVNGFWSLTLYNENHFFSENDLKRYSLGTKNAGLKRNGDGSLTLYAGAPPGKDKESNWLHAPDGPISLYIPAYWGKKEMLGGSLGSPRKSRRLTDQYPHHACVGWRQHRALERGAVSRGFSPNRYHGRLA